MQKIQTPLKYLGIFCCFLACVFILNISSFFNNYLYYTNPDVGWHVQVAKQLLNGHRLYTDITEFNFPLIYYSKIIPVIIADFFGLDAIITTNKMHFIMCLGYFLVSYFQVSRAKNLKFIEKLLMIFAICYGLFILPFSLTGNQFGQKEHYFTILFLPYFLNYFLEYKNKEKLKTFTAISAGFGIITKPYFLIIFICLEIYRSFVEKKFITRLQDKEFRVISVILLLFGTLFLTYFYGYFNNTLPLLEFLYHQHSAFNPVIFQRLIIEHISGFLLIPCYFVLNKNSKIFGFLVSFFIAGFLISLIQNKSIQSVRYIFFFAEIILASFCFASALEKLKKHKNFEGSIAAMILILFILTTSLYAKKLTYAYNLNLNYQQKLYTEIEELLLEQKGRKAFVISSALNYTSPPILNAGKETEIFYSSAWAIKSIGKNFIEREFNDVKYNEAINLRDKIANNYARQIRKYAPDILIIIDFDFVLNKERDTISAHDFFIKSAEYKNYFREYKLVKTQDIKLGKALVYTKQANYRLLPQGDL